jgi:hypothetical protein
VNNLDVEPLIAIMFGFFLTKTGGFICGIVEDLHFETVAGIFHCNDVVHQAFRDIRLVKQGKLNGDEWPGVFPEWDWRGRFLFSGIMKQQVELQYIINQDESKKEYIQPKKQIVQRESSKLRNQTLLSQKWEAAH